MVNGCQLTLRWTLSMGKLAALEMRLVIICWLKCTLNPFLVISYLMSISHELPNITIAEYQLDDVHEFSRNLKYINNYMDQEMYSWNADTHTNNQQQFHGHKLYCK